MKYGQLQFARLRARLSCIRAQTRNSWKKRSNIKVLFVVENQKITRSQIFPFYFYLSELEQKFKLEFREYSVASVQNDARALPGDADIIGFQPWFTLGSTEILRLIHLLRESNPAARIIFLDSYAPLDLRFAEMLEPTIDLYLKKHVFSDRSLYGKSTHGDTNLVEYYEQLYELPRSPDVSFPVTETFLSKLVLGPTFYTSNYLLPRFFGQERAPVRTRNIRVHARLGCKGTAWYQSMRKQSLTACEPFRRQSIVSSDFVRFSSYADELSRSLICFSPFGYGEVCMRDFEAIAFGSLLVKPDMSHVETDPNVFIPYETYVPAKWDFSDLAEIVDYYLSHEDEAKNIASNAYRLIHDYCRHGHFVEQVKPLFTL